MRLITAVAFVLLLMDALMILVLAYGLSQPTHPPAFKLYCDTIGNCVGIGYRGP